MAAGNGNFISQAAGSHGKKNHLPDSIPDSTMPAYHVPCQPVSLPHPHPHFTRQSPLIPPPLRFQPVACVLPPWPASHLPISTCRNRSQRTTHARRCWLLPCTHTLAQLTHSHSLARSLARSNQRPLGVHVNVVLSGDAMPHSTRAPPFNTRLRLVKDMARRRDCRSDPCPLVSAAPRKGSPVPQST